MFKKIELGNKKVSGKIKHGSTYHVWSTSACLKFGMSLKRSYIEMSESFEISVIVVLK